MQHEIVRNQHFSRDEKRLSADDRKKVEMAVEKLATSAIHDRRKLWESATQPQRIKLVHNLTSSLFVAKAGPKLRVLFTLDDDPLFDRTVMTLFRIVKAEEAELAYEQVARSLYKDLGYNGQEN